MADIKRIESREFPISDIRVGDRLRGISESGVGAVLASLEETKIIGKHLWLRKLGDGYELIDGAHRLEAAKRFGMETVPCTVFECSAQQARLLEIDGNLAGAELNALDTAVFLARRKSVYEEMHPEAKRGLAGAVARWDATDMMSVASFSSATAEKFGMSDRHVRRMIMAGDALSDTQAAELRKAEQPVKLADLMEIAKIGEETERAHVIGALSRGEAKSAKEARAQFKPKSAPPKDPVEEAFQDLLKRWSRAPKAAKLRFVDEKLEELETLRAQIAAAHVFEGHSDSEAFYDGDADE